MGFFIFMMALLFICWLICNNNVSKLLKKYQEYNQLVASALSFRKTIMFDIIALTVLFIFDINFFTWFAILFNILMAIIEGIMIIIAILPIYENQEEKIAYDLLKEDMHTILFSKILNELSLILMIIALFDIWD